MPTDRNALVAAIAAELDHAYLKHGRDPWGKHEWYGVLLEEVDELWDAIKRDLPREEVLREAVQVAAMVFRYIETGDRYTGAHPPIPTRTALGKVPADLVSKKQRALYALGCTITGADGALVDALAIDNQTGGGIEARLYLAVYGVPKGTFPDGVDVPALARIYAQALAALGIPASTTESSD